MRTNAKIYFFMCRINISDFQLPRLFIANLGRYSFFFAELRLLLSLSNPEHLETAFDMPPWTILNK
jgi:hypothetical protein